MADLLKQGMAYLAETDFRGAKTRFGIKNSDRARHVYVIGKTGMGKSTLLENMAIQDMANGEGLGFIDPHGGTAEKLLDYIPEERTKDVIYFAPYDLDYPISFNVMEDVGKDQRYLVANGLMSSFKKIWPDVWSARMEYILNNTLLALLEYPDSTLLGVNRMLSDKNYRTQVVNNISDPSVKAFWLDEFAKYNERYMQEAGDAIKNKIGQFTSNPLIRNIIGQPKSSFDIREVMDGKKILIMNLSKGRVGEQNAFLLGGMLITKIYLAAMSRANATTATLQALPSFYLFVDEFQSFVNDSFADILAEARKYKLNLTIAHQNIDQMPETVQSAVFGNVGTTIAFRVGPFDAEKLEKIFSPKFTEEDLVNLGFAQIYLTLMIDGVGSPSFSATTLAPIENAMQELHAGLKEQIIASSRAQYAHPREEVEKAITEWHKVALSSIEKADRAGRVNPPAGGQGPSKKYHTGSRTSGAAEVRLPFQKRATLIKEAAQDRTRELSLEALVAAKNKETVKATPQAKEDLKSFLQDVIKSVPKEKKEEVPSIKDQADQRSDFKGGGSPTSDSQEIPEDELRHMLEVPKRNG